MLAQMGLLLSRMAKDWAVQVSLEAQVQHATLLPLAPSFPALMQPVPPLPAWPSPLGGALVDLITKNPRLEW